MFRTLASKIPVYLLTAALLAVIAGCNEEHSSTIIEGSYKVALLPDQQINTVIEKHDLLFQYLQQEVGANFDLIVPPDYATALKLFVEKKVDIAYFGGATFVKAKQQANAKPLIARDIDAEFTSVVIVNSKIQAKQLDDLKGRSFSFGSKLSTSGHLMPRYFFEQKNIIAESYFGKIIYSGAHDRTALLISRGEVDAGVVNASIAQAMFEDGRLQRSKVKIIWHSPQYQDYVWAIQPDMDDHVRYKIRDAFLALNSETETGRQILSNLEANYFIPVSASDYEMLESILDNLAVSD